MTAVAVAAEDTYVSAQGLAKILGVSKWTLYRISADWPHSLVGSRRRYSPEDVATIKNLLRAATAPPATSEAPQHSAAALARASQRLGLPARL